MTYLFGEENKFSIILSDDWQELSSNDPEIYSFIRKENSIGAIQISLARRIEEKDPTKSECEDKLKFFFQKQNLKPQIEISSMKDGFIGYAQQTTKEGRFLMIWLVSSKKRFAFITYSCRDAEKDKEIKEVQEMINTFRLN